MSEACNFKEKKCLFIAQNITYSGDDVYILCAIKRLCYDKGTMTVALLLYSRNV